MPYVQAGDVRLNYVEHGTGPEPLVFVHGASGSARRWAETLSHLPEGYRAYAFDLRGAGESDKPDGPYSPAVFAEDIHLATRALGLESFTFVGHSLGGVAGIQLALTRPERLRGLVLVTPVPSAGLPMDPAVRAQQRANRRNREFQRRLVESVFIRPVSEEVIQIALEDAQKWPDSAYDAVMDAMAAIDLSDQLATIATPTLMVVGDRDFLRRFNLEDAGRIPNCALQVFYRAGHALPWDVPRALAEVIDDFVQHGVAPPPSVLTSGRQEPASIR